MTAGWCCRATRAAVFAAVCVLLAVLGHVLMSDASVPWWSLAAALGGTGGAAWCLAGRERGVLAVSSVVVVAQTALHEWFSYVQRLTAPTAAPPPASGTGGASDAGHTAAMAHLGHAMHPAAHGGSATVPPGAMDSMTGFAQVMEAMSASGMLAAHLLAAVLSGLWLAFGERAAFRLLRAVAGLLAAPLRLILALPAVPHRPRAAPRRAADTPRPPRLLLVHAITSRGPPAGPAVV
ncbi:hypothetical protein [Streptomyces parvulus]|uniref:hypothetical protein n=1 Tax=Streptomyces parvulus TaxID=146923 RepID=UPI0033D20C5C